MMEDYSQIGGWESPISVIPPEFSSTSAPTLNIDQERLNKVADLDLQECVALMNRLMYSLSPVEPENELRKKLWWRIEKLIRLNTD
jgi:hypothetical protein